MSRKVETEVFEFAELAPEIQEKVISDMAYINVEHEWWDFLYDDAAEIGVKINNFDIARRRIEGTLTEDIDTICKKILANHGKNCATYRTAKKYSQNTSLDKTSFNNDILRDYLKMLNDDDEFLTSQESVKETIVTNGYEFTRDGQLFFMDDIFLAC